MSSGPGACEPAANERTHESYGATGNVTSSGRPAFGPCDPAANGGTGECDAATTARIPRIASRSDGGTEALFLDQAATSSSHSFYKYSPLSIYTPLSPISKGLIFGLTGEHRQKTMRLREGLMRLNVPQIDARAPGRIPAKFRTNESRDIYVATQLVR